MEGSIRQLPLKFKVILRGSDLPHCLTVCSPAGDTWRHVVQPKRPLQTDVEGNFKVIALSAGQAEGISTWKQGGTQITRLCLIWGVTHRKPICGDLRRKATSISTFSI